MTQQTQIVKSKPAQKQAKAEAFEPNLDERHALIEKEAYLLAEQRGFDGDRQLEDWIQAETAIESRFTNTH